MTITSIARLAVKGGKYVGKLIKNGKVTNWIKRNPKEATFFGAAGLFGVGLEVKWLTSTKKEKNDWMKRFALANPYINPIGCWDAMINNRTTVNEFDTPFAKYFVDKYDNDYQKYYDNLSPQEKVREFYKNGGKGLNFTKNE